MMQYKLDYLEELEAEAIYIIREAYAQFERPCILFSGGKDSITLCHLAAKAFAPVKIPFSLVHIDTGHNFVETLQYRDALVERMTAHLIVGSVEKSIQEGRVTEESGIHASRNRAQITTLLDTIASYGFDAALGGGRRDEEKARAKERIFSHRDEFGQWDPKNQRPELWDIYNGRKHIGEHFRIFPISNWTELDVWMYIKREAIPLPSLYFSHERTCIRRGDTLLAHSEFIKLQDRDEVLDLRVRFRTIGDLTITGAMPSTASNVDEVIDEIIQSRTTERGMRADDLRSEASMEDRKREGYF
jgi:sulfate adenylyltransferase subunit 2